METNTRAHTFTHTHTHTNGMLYLPMGDYKYFNTPSVLSQ
uniref:Uncharacterized protein n=1 Tax=Anguilla anguilla TaxID=7936 RepID=A0A0E9WGI8_ANGAN